MNDILTIFLHAIILLSFSIIQSIVIFNQGATQPKFQQVLPSIVSASRCDTILIYSAVFGLSLIIFKISALKLTILILGFIFLLYMGYNTWNLTNNSNALAS